MRTQKSFSLPDKNPTWHIINAENLVVGRLATTVADLLRGKNKPTYTPNCDSGDFVVVTNCDKLQFTGNKWDEKLYYWHTNHVGGIKQRSAAEQKKKHPELILKNAVKGMLPKNSLGRQMLKKLKIYVDTNHPHEAQNPQPYTGTLKEL